MLNPGVMPNLPREQLLPPRCVLICAVSVAGSTGDISRFRSDLTHAQAVYRTCGLTIQEGSFTRISDVTLLDFPTWTNTNVPQAALRLIGLGRACQPDLTVFYVRSLGEGVVGRGGPTFANGGPGLVVTDGASQNTFAHELGHAFLGGNEAHSPDPTNVMYSPSGAIGVSPPRVTAAQCERIYEQVTRLTRIDAANLVEALKTGDTPTCCRALAIFRRMGGPIATLAAAIMTVGAADPVIRLTAATVLSYSRSPLVEPILITCTHDPDPGVRLAGFRGLTTQRTVSALTAMVQSLMGEHDPSIRAAAIRLLNSGEV